MNYLSVSNFWKYQDRNAWKKTKTHPPWFKLYVHRDRELDALPQLARLLFYELLACATRNSNVLEADLNWIWAETRVEPETIREYLPVLLKGGWLSQTKSARRAPKPVPDPAPKSDVLDVDVDVDVEKGFSSLNKSRDEQRIRRLIHNGVITDHVDLEAELRAANINGAAAETLKTELPPA